MPETKLREDACPGQDVGITGRVYNPMGCAETFSWQVQKKSAPDGGEASVNFTPGSGSTGSVAAQSWSAAIPITATVGAGSPPGSSRDRCLGPCLVALVPPRHGVRPTLRLVWGL